MPICPLCKGQWYGVVMNRRDCMKLLLASAMGSWSFPAIAKNDSPERHGFMIKFAMDEYGLPDLRLVAASIGISAPLESRCSEHEDLHHPWYAECIRETLDRPISLLSGDDVIQASLHCDVFLVMADSRDQKNWTDAIALAKRARKSGALALALWPSPRNHAYECVPHNRPLAHDGVCIIQTPGWFPMHELSMACRSLGSFLLPEQIVSVGFADIKNVFSMGTHGVFNYSIYTCNEMADAAVQVILDQDDDLFSRDDFRRYASMLARFEITDKDTIEDWYRSHMQLSEFLLSDGVLISGAGAMQGREDSDLFRRAAIFSILG